MSPNSHDMTATSSAATGCAAHVMLDPTHALLARILRAERVAHPLGRSPHGWRSGLSKEPLDEIGVHTRPIALDRNAMMHEPRCVPELIQPTREHDHGHAEEQALAHRSDPAVRDEHAGMAQYLELRGLLDQPTPLACLYLPVRINGDVALLKGLCKAVQEAGAQDEAFIAAHTQGYEAFCTDLDATTWQEITDGCGVSEAEIRAAGALASQAKRLVLCWAMGLTQHKNGVANVQYLVNLVLLRGMLGKDGGGLLCVRGHSNVQGDRSMGIYEKMPDTWMDRLGQVFAFTPPRKHGLDTVEAIQALSATPDTEVTAEALRQCSLTVQVSTKLNRSHLVTGETALILPCLGRTEQDMQASGEQFVTVEDSVSNVHASRGTLEPASPALKSEPAIVAELAQAVLGDDWSGFVSDYNRIREKIAAVVPGFEDFNTRVRVPGGFVLPNPPRERQFATASGKAHFTVHPIPQWQIPPGEWLMMTIRTHDQFNTTIYGNDDRYRGIYGGRRVVLVHPDDAAQAGLTKGELVDIVSVFEGEERRAEKFVLVPYGLPRRCCATYFPEANVLIPLRSHADKSKTPTSKSVVVRLTPSG